jgi:hypothetical protein
VGYTHYWLVDPDVEPARLVEAGRGMAKVIRAAQVPLADGFGRAGTEPVIDLDAGTVWFNGVAEEGRETFSWPPDLNARSHDDPGRAVDFCKTWRMPYDAVVVACLLVAQRVLGDRIEIGSDGNLNDFLDRAEIAGDDEETARALYTRVFEEDPDIPPWFHRSREQT